MAGVIRVGLKLPTGDEQELAGSGATDLFVDLSSPTVSVGEHWSARASAGLLFTGDSDLFTNQRSLVAFGSAALSWRYTPAVTLMAQLGWHTPFFDSELTELGEFSMQLDVGGTWNLSRSTALELAIQEDIAPDTAPDIVLYLGFRRRYL